MNRFFVAAAAVFALLAVLLGAFGAHGLQALVTEQRLETWNTAAHYLGWNATGLLALSAVQALSPPSRWLAAAGWLLIAGTLIFSGSLFVLVLTDVGVWGAVTPFGGVALAMGWLSLLVGALRR